MAVAYEVLVDKRSVGPIVNVTVESKSPLNEKVFLSKV